RAHFRRTSNRRALSARPKLPYFGRICRTLPAGLGGAGPSDRGRTAVKQVSVADRYDRLLRVALPIVVLTIGLLILEAVVQVKNIPPYVLPGPHLILRTPLQD